MKSRQSCYSNQNGQKRAKLDRNEDVHNSRLSNFHNTLPQNSLGNFSSTIQSVNLISKKKQISSNEMSSGKAKKKIEGNEDKKVNRRQRKIYRGRVQKRCFIGPARQGGELWKDRDLKVWKRIMPLHEQ